MKNPVLGVLNFPTINQQANRLAFVEIIGAQTTQHLTPNAVHQRNTVSVRIEGIHGFGNADRDSRLCRLKHLFRSGNDEDGEKNNGYRSSFHKPSVELTSITVYKIPGY